MGLPLYETARLLQSACRHWRRAMSVEILINVAPRENARARCSKTARCRSCSSSAPAAAGWSAISTRAGSRGCCRACRRRSWRSGWRAPRSCTWPTSCSPPPTRATMQVTGPAPRDRHPHAGARRRRAAGAGGQGSAGHQGRALTTHVSLPSRYLVYHAARLAASACRRASSPRTRAQALREPCMNLAQRARRWRRLHRAHRGSGRRPKRCAPTCCSCSAVGACARTRGCTPAGQAGARGPAAARARAARRAARRVDRVLVDHRREFARMLEFARTFMPEYADRIELHEATGRSSTCTAWRRRSNARWSASAAQVRRHI